ncbi:Major facilitator superfamily domain general substrate transporter [Penicillium atrosanguineum]|uniref:Major facilitator superfamily domain general substrate transporter n=1 Tax=Penicillium atrosanguineum TaxID=1132637 RepID=A0A9W9GF44_9EURO|nr:Major facilitator superfamily domain general substrate transporter [Penicillium atrosanguineum]KAJ5119263.1 Major facilitator superfamily domain general substrate transporter [Penicillium atrosanguineum]KAJ5299026.1 Major facilitator superfamily domain general substrate transporter [Penicillium atrosanguineum]
MAGGAKKPVNIFRLKNLGEPKEIFNWRLWFAVTSFGLMGAARGIDEGLISGAFNSKDFQRYIDYSSYSKVEQTNIKANVSAMVQIGSVGGALFAFIVCDRIGRIWATRQLCLLWILGIAIFMGNNGSLGAVYAGRFIAGLGVGQTVVVAPVYLAEISPASIRGLCTCVFTGFVYLGVYFCQPVSSWPTSQIMAAKSIWATIHTRDGQEVPTSLHIIFAGLIFILSFLQYESPRYLVKRGQQEKALVNLARVRGLPVDHEYVVHELNAIQTAHQTEMEATMGSGPLGVIKETFLIPSNLYRLYLALTAQILSQWSGAGSITVYATDLFKLLDITGSNENLLVTAIFGIVKLTAAILCALFLVDVIGRKRALLLGITLQAISMIYIAGFLTAVPEIGTVDGYKVPANKKGASEGAIAMIYVSGFGWALGWNSMQYLLTAELFPLRIRALATSLAMTLHFANQYGNSRAVPNMLLPAADGGISPKGTFWFFGVVTLIGGLWVWFSVPETAGRSLESMDQLFALPWYRIGLHGNKDADERDLVINEKMEAMEAQGTTQHVERQDVASRV